MPTSSSDVAIRVQGLSKQYHIGQREQYRALRDTLGDALATPARLAKSALRRGREPEDRPQATIWALKDISLEIPKGQVLGIIGRNGAGKSTLLKVLSRITEPTEGRVEIRGRVGSLLEVGTGFHPELTGRENIYLNGAILGMHRADIERKFDDIVAFAEVEQFIDTPVKHYSSGMYVRLAFAVAAHLEPEILLIDEVLAVGDAAFQKKCLGKMGDVAREGRTVLFVSHTMPAVERLCDRAIVIEKGRLLSEGDPSTCIAHYLASGAASEAVVDLAARPRTDPRLTPILTRLEILHGDGQPTAAVGCGEPLELAISYASALELPSASFGVIVADPMGAPLFHLQTRAQIGLIEKPPRRGTIRCRLDEVPLVPGEYLLTVGCTSNDNQVDLLEQVVSLTVEPRDYFQTGFLPHHVAGYGLVRAGWEVVDETAPARRRAVARA